MAWITVHLSNFSPRTPVRVNSGKITQYRAGTSGGTTIKFENGEQLFVEEPSEQLDQIIANAEAYGSRGPQLT